MQELPDRLENSYFLRKFAIFTVAVYDDWLNVLQDHSENVKNHDLSEYEEYGEDTNIRCLAFFKFVQMLRNRAKHHIDLLDGF